MSNSLVIIKYYNNRKAVQHESNFLYQESKHFGSLRSKEVLFTVHLWKLIS